MKLISGNANYPLAMDIADYLSQPLCAVTINSFNDGELHVELLENIRGEDVFIIQSTSSPCNDNLMELLILIDTCKRASAKTITSVIPYFGYSRQDRKPKSRTPITAKLVADILQTAGVHRILTLDLHVGQIQGFFDVPVDDLYFRPIIAEHIKREFADTLLDGVTIISPDAGGTARARATAKVINSDIAIIDKRRDRAGASEVMNVIGDVKNKYCIIVDDIIDTGGTLCNAADVLLDKGSLGVTAYISHGVLSGNCISKVNNSNLDCLYITDSICNDEVTLGKKIRILSVSSILGEAIDRINSDRSISKLFI